MVQLAKELNLSIGTVSKALQDSYEISAKTKERVLELAKKYNYRPNPFASSLRKGKSKSIAVVIPEIANDFFSLTVDAIQTFAIEKGYNVFVYVTHENLENEIAVLRHLEASQVDGIIMSMCSQAKDFYHIEAFCEQAQLPIVFFDRIAMLDKYPRVITNNYEGAYQATNHLFKQGARSPLFLYNSEWIYINAERLRGFKDAAEKHNCIVDDGRIVKCTEDSDINYTIIQNILTDKNPPDAIFTSVEKLALTVYQVAIDLALKIPQDFKVISFSNLRTASLLNPSLSTIEQPAYEMGEQSAKLLFKIIEKKFYRNANDIITINSKLEVRNSTRV